MFNGTVMTRSKSYPHDWVNTDFSVSGGNLKWEPSAPVDHEDYGYPEIDSSRKYPHDWESIGSKTNQEAVNMSHGIDLLSKHKVLALFSNGSISLSEVSHIRLNSPSLRISRVFAGSP